jgi:glycosyltransferase involved in cell wall biosynthesis
VASRDELREHYRRADVFVLPSLAEGMALVVLEAMAAGLPVVVTEESGYRGVVRHGLDGLVVPARSGQAIAGALDVLSESGELRQQMGLAARRRAEEYDWQRFESAVIESFRTLVADTGWPPSEASPPDVSR